MATYVSKPTTCEAWRFFFGNGAWFLNGGPCPEVKIMEENGQHFLWVAASAAWCSIDSGDYVIRDKAVDAVAYYPCKPNVFTARWELAE